MDVYERTLDEMNATIARAASAYEARWSWLALRRVDPDIAGRLDRQRKLYETAKATRSIDGVTQQGQGLCRGYRKAVEAMEAAQEPEDNYLVGQCPRTGLRIVISDNPGVAQTAGESMGCGWFSPDEIAALFADTEGARALMAVKRAWPGATIQSVTSTEKP